MKFFMRFHSIENKVSILSKILEKMSLQRAIASYARKNSYFKVSIWLAKLCQFHAIESEIGKS